MDPSATLRELRSLQFFRDRTGPDLSGYFMAPFWERIVFQASHQHPSIKHALVAVSSLHETIELASYPDDASSTSAWRSQQHLLSLSHYNKAIALLTTPPKDQSVPLELVLITCALFSCYENLQGNFARSLRHAQSGLSIIEERQTSSPDRKGYTSPSSEPDMIDTYLAPIFSHLTVERPGGSRSPEVQPLQGEPPGGPSTFDETEVWNYKVHPFGEMKDACGSLGRISTLMCEAIDSYRGSEGCLAESPLALKLEDIFATWKERLRELIKEDPYKDNPSAQRAAEGLQIHQVASEMTIWTSFASTECVYDAYTETFRSLVCMCQRFMDELPAPDRHFVFRTDLGILPRLYKIVSSCREPSIRRQALKLLRQSRRRENIWSGWSAANIVERVMDIEEKGLTPLESCKDIPESSRIRLVGIHMDHKERRIHLFYTHFPYDPALTDIKESIIEWAVKVDTDLVFEQWEGDEVVEDPNPEILLDNRYGKLSIVPCACSSNDSAFCDTHGPRPLPWPQRART